MDPSTQSSPASEKPTTNGGSMSGMSSGRSGFMGGKRDPETMRNQLASLKTDLDDLVSRAGTLGETELAQAHDQIMSQFSSMRHAARGMASQASKQFKSSVDVTSGYVKDKPMQSVGVATVIGLALGMLLARR